MNTEQGTYSRLIRDGIDIHLHTAPDIVPRSVDDYQEVDSAQRAGMRAIVLKSHLGSTAERASLVAARTGFTVLGSVALNRFVGGLNPLALDTALRLGARLVWMPTVHAQNQLDSNPHPGPILEALLASGVAGICVLDEGEQLSAEAEVVLRRVAASGAALATGHLSPRETAVVVRRAKEIGVRAVSITHPLSSMVSMAPDNIERLVKSYDAFAEFPYVDTTGAGGPPIPLAEIARVIRQVGTEHAIISSDGGQQSNPPPTRMLSLFADGLCECGFTDEEIHTLVAVNPARLLGLDL